MNNRHSLFTIITLFYIPLVLGINLLLGIHFVEHQRQVHQQEARRYFDILLPQHHERDKEPRRLRQEPPEKAPPPFSFEELQERLALYDIHISNKSVDAILKGKRIDESHRHALYELDGKRYFAFFEFNSGEWVVLEDENPPLNTLVLWIMVFVGVNLMLLFFYLFLFRKLKPLRRLKNDIHRFAEGERDLDTSMEGKDEISEVANAFNQAIAKIRILQDSRNLFLRNIMHELKTPITKGKITVDMLDDTVYKERLVKAFNRLEFLLGEFAKVERITSGYFELKRHPFRMMDVLDHAVDLLHLNPEEIEIDADASYLDVDFELFATALKNLIDNALKYGKTKPKVIIRDHSVEVINQGEALQKPFDAYLQPFNRSYEHKASLGLGLGLYITDSIIKAHKMQLSHHYDAQNGTHHILIS